MKRISLLFILLLSLTVIKGQKLPKGLGPQDIVMYKNYYFTFLLKENPVLNQLLSKSELLNKMLTARNLRLKEADQCKDPGCLVTAFKWDKQEIEILKEVFSKLWEEHIEFKNLAEHQLILSKAYGLQKDLSGKDYLIKALTQDLRGMNYVIDVYGAGKKPNYPKIDSISFDIKSNLFFTLMAKVQQDIVYEAKSADQYFYATVLSALRLLEMNERWDAAQLEPLTELQNKAALAAVKKVKFGRYPYNSILVLGSGPSQYNQRISPNSMLRCRKAARSFAQGLAPFIIVSGGRVHPYKTEFIEALEMKKYLMEVLAVPEANIIIEPHARHTTTNIRNASRILIHYQFPQDKFSIINSHEDNLDMVGRMAKRCVKELGYVPYTLGKRVDKEILEFKPSLEALTIDADEPLDP